MPSPAAPSAAAFQSDLLAWYDRHRRTLPWRAPPGVRADPYHVWLSEIMLQQTTVPTVGRYFEKFLRLWPTVSDLAAAPRDDVMAAWAGLGYYARARNLHSCAQTVAEDLNGKFPDDEEGLRALPGIGAYTAAAVAAIAYNRPAVVLDGNIERVMARWFAVETPLPAAKSELREHAATLTPSKRPGDHAQALMDLGAMVCTPRKPVCALCPVSTGCRARAAGIAETLPRKAPKKQKPTRRGLAFWLEDGRGQVLLRRRPDKGLLGGMMEFPSTPWTEEASPDLAMAEQHAPSRVDWTVVNGVVRHTFTHFHLELAIAKGSESQPTARDDPYRWASVDALENEALPTVMRKVARLCR
ncbi:MAG: A/G-specific adenine glycosylase [Pseudomonadota bacterium]